MFVCLSVCLLVCSNVRLFEGLFTFLCFFVHLLFVFVYFLFVNLWFVCLLIVCLCVCLFRTISIRLVRKPFLAHGAQREAQIHG